VVLTFTAPSPNQSEDVPSRRKRVRVVEVRHVLWSGLQLEEISATNKLPLTCNRLQATRKRAGKIATQEHEEIVEEAGRRDRLDFNEDEVSDDVEESGSEVESDSDDSFN
jgi:hypothetical protein